MGDFRREILEETDHRPWPMPDAPWIMTQTWNDLLFAHWPVDPQAVASKLPPGLELDTFDGGAWLGIVPFHMTNVSPRGVPALPWLSAFPEVNVRTYVRAAGRPGVFFFSLDADSALAVAAAKTLFHLPYYTAAMRVETRNGWMEYSSRRTAAGAPPAALRVRYRPTGPPAPPSPGTLDAFLTERYCLFTVHRERIYTVDIHHPPWPLQPAEANFDVNTMAKAAGFEPGAAAPLLHFARRHMVGWRLREVG